MKKRHIEPIRKLAEALNIDPELYIKIFNRMMDPVHAERIERGELLEDEKEFNNALKLYHWEGQQKQN